MDPTPTAVILFAHGSNVSEANQAIAELAEEVSRRAGLPAQCAFLELTQPDLSTAVARAVRGGAKRVIIIPYFLTVGVHVREDLPQLVERQRVLYPGIEVQVGEPLEGHPGLAEVILDRVREALTAEGKSPRAE